MRLSKIALIVFLLVISCHILYAEDSRLLRHPAINDTHIAFVYAGDIWLVERQGGQARQLTTSDGLEMLPRFSPDGKWIAFTGQYDGNTDVFVMPALGGEPERLTYHPGADNVRGWTHDGKYILFASGRESAPVPYHRLWRIAVEGGYPEALPLPMAHRGAFSPDGTHMAYVPFAEANTVWRHYRGGRTTPVWILTVHTWRMYLSPKQIPCGDITGAGVRHPCGY